MPGNALGRLVAPAPVSPRRTARFRQLLARPELDFLMEAHNGVSARIAEEAGFQAIWAGGLCMSAQYGVRDSNEASWTQVLEMLEFMADATSLPILMDGDTGYGNFNNVRRLVRKLEQRGIAAVCIEDKLYPKTNSFIDGTRQELADVDEFCSRIKAGKDAQRDDDFAIITRVEAFIAGWGLSEALRRAEAYHAAGSDGILIHSALSQPSEVRLPAILTRSACRPYSRKVVETGPSPTSSMTSASRVGLSICPPSAQSVCPSRRRLTPGRVCHVAPAVVRREASCPVSVQP